MPNIAHTILQFGKNAADFTVCLKIHHFRFTFLRYYIATLHFHIFLLFSYFFFREKYPLAAASGYFFAIIKILAINLLMQGRKSGNLKGNNHRNCDDFVIKNGKIFILCAELVKKLS